MDNLDVLIISQDNGLITEICRHLDAWKKRHAVYSNSLGAISHLSQLSTSSGDSIACLFIIDGRELDLDPEELASSLKNKFGIADSKLLYLASPDSDNSALETHRHGYHNTINHQDVIPQLLRHLHKEISPSESNKTTPLAEQKNSPHQVNYSKAILLAEHNDIDRKALEITLRNAGHKVISVKDGDQASQTLEDHTFDLAIINFELPIMNGTQVIRLHRLTTPYNQQVPFIMLLENKTTDSIRTCNDLQVAASLYKPAMDSLVIDTIKTYFNLEQPPKQKQIRRTKSRK